MSRTISFRASEDLDEFLEEEAERRMTTKSTVAQMLLAERVRELVEEREEDSDESSDPKTDLGSSSEGSEDSSDSSEDPAGNDELPEIMRKLTDKWYIPDSPENDYAVYENDDGELGRPRYYKTIDGAEQKLRKEWRE